MKLSLGAVVPVDIKITDGSVLVDQSILTGESVPVELGAGKDTYAGALVRRGEAIGTVTQTGPRTKFGHTAALVQTVHVVSSQQTTVLKIVRNLAIFNSAMIFPMVGYAYFRGMGWRRHRPAGSHRCAGLHPGCSAGYLYPCKCAGSEGTRQAGGSCHKAFRGGRSRDDGRSLRRQNRNIDRKRAPGRNR